MADPAAKALKNFVRLSSLCDAATRVALMDLFKAEARRVPVPAGVVLVWSSRTIHQVFQGSFNESWKVAFKNVGAEKRLAWLLWFVRQRFC
jgi:hypothetical protein